MIFTGKTGVNTGQRPVAATARGFVDALRQGHVLPLLCVDGVMVGLHVAYRFGVTENPDFLLGQDRGLAEMWQYCKAAAIVLIMALIFRVSREPIHAAWAFVFSYVLLDDMLMIHETAGAWLADYFALVGAHGLRAVDIGEMLAHAVPGVAFASGGVWAYVRSGPRAREHARCLFMAFVLLVFFGLGADMIHSAIDMRGLSLLEDGGEMLAMTMATACCISVLKPQGPWPAGSHRS